jgi:hypothetical protein
MQSAHGDARESRLTLCDRTDGGVVFWMVVEPLSLAQLKARIHTLISITQELGRPQVPGITINADGEVLVESRDRSPLAPEINGQPGGTADYVLAVIEFGARIWTASKEVLLDVPLLRAANIRLPNDDGHERVGRYAHVQDIFVAYWITGPIAAARLDYANRPTDPRVMLEGLIGQIEMRRQPTAVGAATATNRTN